ncbi:MAG: penicillin-binding protein activator [Robiginitomaculum sp.]|nr:penicillin-binding protein activator [Robiginitomaculum sp.]
MFDPRLIFSFCLASFLLIGCATTDGPATSSRPSVDQRLPTPTPPTSQPIPEPASSPVPVITLPHMQGRAVVRLALLLPFSASNEALRDQAQSMLNAAQLAVLESNDLRLVLLPKDTRGSEIGAGEAARSALRDGADIIIGPLLSRAVLGAARAVSNRQIPMIAFSTDRNVAGNGVYLMSFQPEVEVARIINYAANNELTSFALLRGQTAYGQRVEQALYQHAAANGAHVTAVETYARDTRTMNAPAARIAQNENRQAALVAWRAAGGFGDPALDPNFVFDLPFAAVLLPESGIRLQSLAPLLPFYDVDPRKTRFLGTGLWLDESLTREPALRGGWFPGPDPQSMNEFTTSYEQAFSHKPQRLAALAYDAVRVAGTIAQTDHDNQIQVRIDQLEDARGFTGATGLFRFDGTGLVEHMLAVYEMRRGQFVVIDPAPSEFAPVGF